MELIIPDWIDAPRNIGACSTLRRGGVSIGPYGDSTGGGGLNLGSHVGDDAVHVERNRKMMEAILPQQPTWLNQVHGTTVLDLPSNAEVPEGDACVTTECGVVCAILTADCLPALLCDVGGKVVGAAHAGWRGLASGVLENTVARMLAKGASEITAWLGPAIGPDRFEVGQEVMDAFVADHAEAAAAFKQLHDRPGKYLANIYQLARISLARQGIHKVAGGEFCTMSDASRFYSFRREKTTGRMATMIWIKQPR